MSENGWISEKGYDVLGVRKQDRKPKIAPVAPQVIAPAQTETAQTVPATLEAQAQPTGFVGKLRGIFS
jgi:hypothetical protein